MMMLMIERCPSRMRRSPRTGSGLPSLSLTLKKDTHMIVKDFFLLFSFLFFLLFLYLAPITYC